MADKVFRVSPGDPVSAETMNRVIDACNPEVGDGRAMPARSKGLKVTWKNSGNETHQAGEAVTGVWRGRETEAAKAATRFLRDGVCLEGPAGDVAAHPFVCTLLKTAAPGAIVPAWLENTVFGYVRSRGGEPPSAAGTVEDGTGILFSEDESGFTVLWASETGLVGGQTVRFCAMRRESGWRCWFTNGGRWTIEPGEFVGVTGMVDSPLSSAEAVENWRRDGLRLRVKRIGQIDDGNAAWLARGVALDEIPSDAVGRGTAPGVFMALVWRDPDAIGESRRFIERADWKTTDWTDPQGVSRRIRRLAFVKYPGDFTVIDAAAPDEDGNVFSLVIPAPPGPVLDTIVSVDVSAGVAQMSCGVAANSPLADLKASDAGRRAMLVRNTVTRGWHVLINHEDMFVKKTNGGESGGTEQNAGD